MLASKKRRHLLASETHQKKRASLTKFVDGPLKKEEECTELNLAIDSDDHETAVLLRIIGIAHLEPQHAPHDR